MQFLYVTYGIKQCFIGWNRNVLQKRKRVTRSEKAIFGQYAYFVWFETLHLSLFYLSYILYNVLNIYIKNVISVWTFNCTPAYTETKYPALLFNTFFYLKQILRKTFHCFPNLRFSVECIYGKRSVLAHGKVI